jgi:hypothetical protein
MRNQTFCWAPIALSLVLLAGTPGILAGSVYVGSTIDPAGDANSSTWIAVSPDITSATIVIDDAKYYFRVEFAPGTFDPITTSSGFEIDADQNPLTGEAWRELGVEAYFGQGDLGDTQNAYLWKPGLGRVATSPVTFEANSVQYEFPRYLLPDDGLMNYVVHVQTALSSNSTTSILDFAPNLQGFDSTSFTSLYFPQVAVGSGYSTLFTVTNTGATAASGNLILTDSSGNSFPVNGELTDSSGTTLPVSAGSSFVYDIPTGGTIFLSATALDSSSSVKVGWAKLEGQGGSLTAVATYEYMVGGTLQARVGVLNSQPLQFATIPVDFDNTQGKQMVYAISNPSGQNISVKLALIGQDGTVVNDSLTVPLGPGQQIASYLSQDLGLPNFKGSLVLRGQNDATFVAVALEYKQNLLTLIPLISGKAPNIPN